MLFRSHGSKEVVGIEKLLEDDAETRDKKVQILHFPSPRTQVLMPAIFPVDWNELNTPRMERCGDNQFLFLFPQILTNTNFLSQFYGAMLLLEIDAESKGLEGEKVDEYVEEELQKFSKKIEKLSKSGVFEYDPVTRSMDMVREKAKEGNVLPLYEEMQDHLDELRGSEDVIKKRLESLTVASEPAPTISCRNAQQLESTHQNTSSRSGD